MGTRQISRQKGFAIANNLGGRLPKLTNILFVVQFFKQENVLLRIKFRVERIHMEKWSGFTSQVGLSKEVLNCCQVGYNLGWAQQTQLQCQASGHYESVLGQQQQQNLPSNKVTELLRERVDTFTVSFSFSIHQISMNDRYSSLSIYAAATHINPSLPSTHACCMPSHTKPRKQNSACAKQLLLQMEN